MFRKEDYVSLEVAKLLKEKGFDEPCLSQYTKSGTIWGCQEPENFNESEGCFSRPTLYEAQKWLREKYQCYVQIITEFYINGTNFLFQVLFYNESCYDCLADESTGLHGDNGKYGTYEEALNAGILESLKLLDYENIHRNTRLG